MATYTFNPTVLGRMWSNYPSGADESFATKRAKAGANAASDGLSALFNLSGSPNYWYWLRSILIFDTSSIPDAEIIASAKLRLYCDSKSHSTSTNTSIKPAISIVSATPTSDTGLVSGDYAISHYGSTRLASDVGYDDLPTGQYTDFLLNSSGLSNISKTGKTKFGILLDRDLDNSNPSWHGAGVDGFSFEPLGGSHPPELIIYTPEGGSPMIFGGGADNCVRTFFARSSRYLSSLWEDLWQQ